MARLNKQFDPNQHEAMRDFSAIPAGEYLAHIVKSEMKATKNGQGQYLQLEFDIDTPGFNDRKIWTRLNLVNANEAAVEIAERELKSICDAVGVGAIDDSNTLHGKPLIVKVRVDAATANYGESNSIVSYKSAGSMGQQTTVPGMEHPEAGNTAQQPAQQPTQQTPVAEKPSWV